MLIGAVLILFLQIFAYMASALQKQLDDIRRSVEEHHFEYEGNELKMTITVGVTAGQPEESVEEWVNRADMNLYEGKNSGKNKVVAD